MKTLKEIVKQAFDIHVHIGPEVIPRKYTVEKFVQQEAGKISGAVLKNHFYSTVPFISGLKSTGGLSLVGAIVLNNYVGGINPDAVYTQTLITKNLFFVWFPTINSENFLIKSKYEIAPEWVKQKDFKSRKSSKIKGISIFKNRQLSPNTIEVLKLIKKYNLVLATGHISWQESTKLIDKALLLGISRIVITHPVYQKIDMPLKIQKQLALSGCFIEQCYSMYSIDRISIKKIARQIRYVGSQSVILSSDVGQAFSSSPSYSLLKFAKLLIKEGFGENEIFEMMVKNPKTLLK